MKLDVSAGGLKGFVAGIAADLDFGHQRLKQMIKDLTPEQLAEEPAGFSNSIATLVVHISGTEVSFAHRLVGKQPSEELKQRYMLGPHGDRLNVATGETAESLAGKLTESRAILLETLAALQDANLDEELPFGPERTATRRWALALLPYHQNTHVGHIQLIKKQI